MGEKSPSPRNIAVCHVLAGMLGAQRARVDPNDGDAARFLKATAQMRRNAEVLVDAVLGDPESWPELPQVSGIELSETLDSGAEEPLETAESDPEA